MFKLIRAGMGGFIQGRLARFYVDELPTMFAIVILFIVFITATLALWPLVKFLDLISLEGPSEKIADLGPKILDKIFDELEKRFGEDCLFCDVVMSEYEKYIYYRCALWEARVFEKANENTLNQISELRDEARTNHLILKLAKIK